MPSHLRSRGLTWSLPREFGIPWWKAKFIYYYWLLVSFQTVSCSSYKHPLAFTQLHTYTAKGVAYGVKTRRPCPHKSSIHLLECSQEAVTIFFPLSEESAECSRAPVQLSVTAGVAWALLVVQWDCLISREHFFTLLWTCHALSVNSFCWPSLPRPLKGCLGSTETFYNTSFLSSIWLCISFFASVEQLTWSGTSFPVASQTQLWPLHPV